ncbi:MAG: hypothetical protein HY791_19135 [Deltaproteobacteria bacterium]|nr:hypothetical protein [Deltaproteobacteria bacterium]
MSGGYLLDANVLSYFLAFGHEELLLGDLAKVARIVIVEEVRDEVVRHPRYGAAFAERLPRSPLEVEGLALGSSEAGLYAQLHPDPSRSKDKGEHAAIAWAAHHADLVFVANDKNAMWLALAELHLPGGRLIGVRVFIRRMSELFGAFSRAAAVDIARASRGKEPTWWAAWLATLPPTH